MFRMHRARPCPRQQPRRQSVRTALGVGVLIAAACLQSGCQACWSVNDGTCGSTAWGGSGGGINGCGDGDAALFVGALYLALLIPYLIAEACRGCK